MVLKRKISKNNHNPHVEEGMMDSSRITGTEHATKRREIMERTLNFLSMLEDGQYDDDALFKNVAYVNGWMVVRSYRDSSGFFNVGRGYALKVGAEFPMHKHTNSTECLFWIKGKMRVVMSEDEDGGDAKEYGLNSENRVVCIHPGIYHNTIADDEGAMLIYIDVPEEKGLE